MNSRLIFLIFSCLAISSYILPASADSLPLKTVQDLLREYHLVVTGKVLSVSNVTEKNLTSYDVKIIQYVTRPQSFQVITAVTNSTQNGMENTTIHAFNVGDYVQLYLTSTPNGYAISPYSFKIDKSCNFIGPDYTTLLYPSHGAAATGLRFLDSKGNLIEPVVNRELFFQTPIYNDTPMNKTYAEIIITKEGSSVSILDEKKEFNVAPCSAPDVLWNFTLLQSGNYTVKYLQFSRTYENKIFFGNSTLTYGFVVPENNATTKIDHANLLLPLKQFKSGIAPNNVSCNNGLQLILKAEDSSPACVKPDTSNILIERGWAKPV